ncbi:o-succinylbenzoate--CoA ligase [Grimontia sp. NTOU-MAR1]|uniref:o-succinylbenzoate--CoA ligase n=1 Tax=Grimontia sp. NTOU-MAR1 TaxID=3111011 RepID=UPI002DBEA02D|nr:o-succinylbenzoate--CoA ligase [Grimontia sp. NTOU-MAR1]WRV97558.1 o-succinylbenzoate--CoA ligase [Grimontia sp. NTOU-MAR1]
MAGAPISFDTWPWLYWGEVKPQHTALFLEGEVISWQRLVSDIGSMPLLPKPHSRYLAILSQNDYQTLLVILAAWQQGLKTLLINPAFSQALQKEVLEKAAIEMVIDPHTVFPSTESQQCVVVPFDTNDILTLVLTSGSTGTPKAVTHNANAHMTSASGLFSLMPFGESDCWLLSLPIFHISGLAIIWRWLQRGAALKIANTKGDALRSALEGVTHASLVPTQLQRLMQGERPSSLTSVLLGGAVISQALVDEAETKGIGCWCGYGMTEMASTISAKRADRRFSVGSPLPHRELMLSSLGEIMVKGETLSSGYLIGGKLEPLSDGWFATKDKGEWVEGELHILGRLDNMFICGGENVQPESIERVLSVFEGVKQLFILPVADEKWGQVPVALVMGNVNQGDFLAYASSLLPPHQVPKTVYSIPKHLLDVGIKISRRVLADWLAKEKMAQR